MKNSEALYITIYNYLLQNIQNNFYSNNKRLPTEMELAKQFYVSRITSKKALNALADEGLIIRIPGRGSYVKHGCTISAVQQQERMDNKFVALVMGGYESSFGLDIVNGAIDACDKLGLHLIVKAVYSDQQKEAETINSLMMSGVAGIIVQPSQGELYSETILKAVYDKYPIVMIDRKMQGINAPFVGVDNLELSKVAVGKLIDVNHKNIAIVSMGDEKSSTINERMAGYANAFVDNVIAIDKSLWITQLNMQLNEIGLTAEDSGAYEFYVSKIAEHLKQHPEITAIFGTEYVASKAAYDATRRIGKRVPQDISLVSFDMDSSYIGSHSMSHIKQPQREMGWCACEMLYDLINDIPIEQSNKMLDGEWVEGNSIKRLHEH